MAAGGAQGAAQPAAGYQPQPGAYGAYQAGMFDDRTFYNNLLMYCLCY